MKFDNIEIPVLALRGLNIFPEMSISLDVQRDISVNAVNTAMKKDQVIFITAQKDAEIDNPQYNHLYPIGVIAIIKQILKLPDNNLRVLVKGVKTARLDALISKEPFFMGSITPVEITSVKRKTKKTEAIVRNIMSLFDEYFTYTKHINSDVFSMITSSLEDYERFSDLVSSNLDISVDRRQSLLETFSVAKRLELIMEILVSEIELLKLKNNIQVKVKENIDKNQKEYYLREQIRVIQSELNMEVSS